MTIKLKDELCREARHRAVDCGVSLSGWIADVVRWELRQERVVNGSLLDVLGDPDSRDRDVEFPRDESGVRNVEF